MSNRRDGGTPTVRTTVLYSYVRKYNTDIAKDRSAGDDSKDRRTVTYREDSRQNT